MPHSQSRRRLNHFASSRMAKTENDEDSANGRVSATPEKTIAPTTVTVGPGIGTRFRIATAASSDYHPIFEGAQLTVSSVNTILEDLGGNSTKTNEFEFRLEKTA